MAFLCPSRLGRSKQRREIHSTILERINGFDPLVKFEVGRLNVNNPEALRIVLHNFTACSPEELTVRQGQKVHMLFRESDWAYVIAADKKEGFIPFTACAKIVVAPGKKVTKTSVSSECDRTYEHKQADHVNNNTYNVKKDKSLTIQQLHINNLDDTFSGDYTDDSFLSTDWSNESLKHQATIDELRTKCVSQSYSRYDDNKNLIQAYFDSTPYEKLPQFLEIFNSLPNEDTRARVSEDSKTPRQDLNETNFSENSTEIPDDTYVTLFDFRGRHKDDIDVGRDDLVVVLDKTDPFWYWVRKRDGQEGYVPSNYIGHVSDPRVVEIIQERQKRRTPDSLPRPDHFHCRREDCMPVSPRSDTTSVTSSTFETKKRPPKPPRTRVKVPKESKHSNREKLSSNREQKVPEKSNYTSSWSKQKTSKASAHHLSLENLPLAEAKQISINKSLLTSPSSTETSHSGKKSRRRGSNYREYRSRSQRSYTYEESKDYFDAYFYDEPDSGYKSSKHDQDNVVNVAEILKQRSASAKGTNDIVKDGVSQKRSQWMKNGSNDKGHNILNLRQYMHSLPSTTIGGQSNTQHEKALDKSMIEGSKVQEESCDKRSGKQNNELDWSFGYPRKTKSNSNSRSSSAHFIPRDSEQKSPECNNCVNRNVKCTVKSVGSQTDLKDIGIVTPNPSDKMFLELLSATDNLLDVSEKFLSSNKAETNITEYTDNKGDRRSSSSETDEEVNEKCSHFLTNHVIETDFNQLTDRSKTSVAFTSDISEDNISEVQENAKFANHKDHSEKPEITAAVITIEEGDTNTEEVKRNAIKDIHGDNSIYNNSDHMNTSYTEHMSCITVSNNSPRNKSRLSTVNPSEVSSRKSSANTETEGNSGLNCLDVRGVTEFVAQYDYEPESEMAIPIIKNEILHISLDIQEDVNWYWAFSPRLRTYGYVPKLYVKIPLVTII